MKHVLIAAAAFAAVAAHAQESAVERLDASPRHHEWVDIVAGSRTVRTFVAYPEKNADAPAVIVIHENRGLTDWVRSFADQIAEAGYVAVAPDLLSDFDDKHRLTSDFESSDAARAAIYALDADQVTGALRAVKRYAEAVPAANGTVAVAGFCWGGSQAFRFATHADGIAATLVFYGTAPEDDEAFKNIESPVYGFYGENDQRVNATIDRTKARMEKFSKAYDVVIYDDAGHAFMRHGDATDGREADKKARDEAWTRIKKILSSL